MPNGQIKGNCLIWDIDHDLVVWDVKPELRAWQGRIYLSVLNELHGSPANLDVQTASNLDLAKVRDHKLIQYLCQQYACDVFDLMQDDDRVKEEIGFYNPSAWADEDGNPVINENRWKLWRMYSAGLDAANGKEYVRMLRRAMDLGEFHQVIFICHTPLVSELADRVLSVGDGRVVMGNSLKSCS
jgi:hypothetical protein